MTKELPYARVRDGVYQYERRVPISVRRDRKRFAEAFGSRVLFRRSLGAKTPADAMRAYVEIDAEFVRRLSNRPVAAPPSRPIILPTRALIDDDLSAITQRYRSLTIEPIERLHRLADSDPFAAEELARLEYAIEQNGEPYRLP